MISKDKLNHIGELYGQYSSWAIWDADDIRDTSIIERNNDDLRTDVVMVGLNISADISGRWWTNFHAGRNDPKLRLAFNTSRLRGAYMTDIIKSVVQVKGSELMKQIRRGEIDIRQHICLFEQEMTFIGADAKSLFLVFGGDAARLYKPHLARSFPSYVYCEHFACYRKKEDWLRDIWKDIDTHK